MEFTTPPGDAHAIVDAAEGHCIVLVKCAIVDKLEAFVAAGGVLPADPDPGPRTYTHVRTGKVVAVRRIDGRSIAARKRKAARGA